LERTIRLGRYTIYCLHFLATVKQQVVKVYSHNQLLTLLSSAIGSFNAERPIKIYGSLVQPSHVIKNLKIKRLYVVYTGPDKQRRQESLKTLKTLIQG
jgi:hypothetical protein